MWPFKKKVEPGIGVFDRVEEIKKEPELIGTQSSAGDYPEPKPTEFKPLPVPENTADQEKVFLNFNLVLVDEGKILPRVYFGSTVHTKYGESTNLATDSPHLLLKDRIEKAIINEIYKLETSLKPNPIKVTSNRPKPVKVKKTVC